MSDNEDLKKQVFSEFNNLRDDINELKQMMEVYDAIFSTEAGQQAAQKVARYYEVLEHVEQQRPQAAGSMDGYKLSPKEVAAVANCSRVHARTLIEDIETQWPETCSVEQDPLRLKVDFSQTTKRAAEQRDKLQGVSA